MSTAMAPTKAIRHSNQSGGAICLVMNRFMNRFMTAAMTNIESESIESIVDITGNKMKPESAPSSDET